MLLGLSNKKELRLNLEKLVGKVNDNEFQTCYDAAASDVKGNNINPVTVGYVLDVMATMLRIIRRGWN